MGLVEHVHHVAEHCLCHGHWLKASGLSFGSNQSQHQPSNHHSIKQGMALATSPKNTHTDKHSTTNHVNHTPTKPMPNFAPHLLAQASMSVPARLIILLFSSLLFSPLLSSPLLFFSLLFSLGFRV